MSIEWNPGSLTEGRHYRLLHDVHIYIYICVCVYINKKLYILPPMRKRSLVGSMRMCQVPRAEWLTAIERLCGETSNNKRKPQGNEP